MRLQKVFLACPHCSVKRFGQGILFVAFFVFFCQEIRFFVQLYSDQWLCNTRGAFSIRVSSFFMVSVAMGAVLFLGVQWWKEQGGFCREWPWLLLLAGGLSNLLERVLTGCVVDYVASPFFPTFNAADALLTIGVVGVCWNWYARTYKSKSTSSK